MSEPVDQRDWQISLNLSEFCSKGCEFCSVYEVHNSLNEFHLKV